MKLSIFETIGSGAEWSVLTDTQDILTEAPGCNIFLIKDGVIKIPASGCLEGITRLAEFDLAPELGLEVEVTDILAQELAVADGAFLTSTAGGIMPVVVVNERALGGINDPGELTTCLHNLY